jgi:hypothetical protein
MNQTAKIFFAIFFAALSFSCAESDAGKETTGNISTKISTDTSELGQLINLRSFKPRYAKFKYVHIDNSGQNDRISLPGPSDSYLEAILYFNDETYNRILQENLKLSQILTGRNTDYEFDWLDQDIKTELSHSTLNECPATVFESTSLTGGCFTLNGKILLKLRTN